MCATTVKLQVLIRHLLLIFRRPETTRKKTEQRSGPKLPPASEDSVHYRLVHVRPIKAACKSKISSLQTGLCFHSLPLSAAPISVKGQKHTQSSVFQRYSLNQLCIPLANTRTNSLRNRAVYPGLAFRKVQSILIRGLWQSKAIPRWGTRNRTPVLTKFLPPHIHPGL